MLRAVTVSWHIIPSLRAAPQRTIPATVASSDGRLPPSGHKPGCGGIPRSVRPDVAYPRRRSGFFVTGGVGLSNYHINSTPAWDGTGWGVTAGAGYDLRFGRDVSLTPVVNYTWGDVGDVNLGSSGTVFTRWRQNVFDVGLGVTFH